MSKLKRLIVELAALLSQKSVQDVSASFEAKPNKLTLNQLESIAAQVSALKQGTESEMKATGKDLRAVSDLIRDLQENIRRETISGWGRRKLSEALGGQGSLEKNLREAELLENSLRQRMAEIRRRSDDVEKIEALLRQIFSCPAALKWRSVPSLSVNDLAKKTKDSATTQSTKPIKAAPTRSAGRVADSADSFVESEARKLELHYPLIAGELLNRNSRLRLSGSEHLESAARVWHLGQLWFVFFDDAQMDLTDDADIYLWVKTMANKVPRCSVEQEATILMHIRALNMTEHELRLGLSIPVQKLGHSLMLNGNFDDTLWGLIEQRNRANPEMIGR